VLVLSFGPGMNYTFDPGDVTPLEPHGSVYGTLTLADAWGVLEVSAGGCLFVRGADGGFLEARVPAPADPGARPVAGDGWTLALKDGWTLRSGARAGDWQIVRSEAR
jgi:hypothetical protein